MELNEGACDEFDGCKLAGCARCRHRAANLNCRIMEY
jgi:hypothetical protein